MPLSGGLPVQKERNKVQNKFFYLTFILPGSPFKKKKTLLQEIPGQDSGCTERQHDKRHDIYNIKYRIRN